MDESDTTLTYTLFAGRGIGNYPVEILKISFGQKWTDEYLVCFPEIGIFVDGFGRRTRSEDIIWSKVPRGFGRCHSYTFCLVVANEPFMI